MLLPCHHLLLLLLLLASSSLSSIQCQPYSCDEDFSFMGMSMVRNITHCKKLRTLSFELGWNYHNTTTATATNFTLDIVFSAKPPTRDGWVAWGVNPMGRPHMVGTRALIAFNPREGPPVVRTFNVTSGTQLGCALRPSAIEVRVENLRVNHSGETGAITVAATLSLPAAEYNPLMLNHVWQVGPRVVGGEVLMVHEKRLQNFDSMETINLTSGNSIGHRLEDLWAAHGVLSVIGWGFLLPTGAIISRYFRCFPFRPSNWFMLHVGSEIAAFSIGTTAWGIGLSMVKGGKNYKSFQAHRIIGILVFCLASSQMIALWLKPTKEDKYRKYWSIYHHFVGYGLIAFTVINIFKGFSILRPQSRWKWAYVSILITLSCIAVGLEIVTWVKFYRKPKSKDVKVVSPTESGAK